MEQTPMTRERLFALRETIARLENENVPGLLKAARKGAPEGFEPAGSRDFSRHVLPLGIAALDDVLQGGLPLAGLTEIRAAETRDAGAAMGFVLALAALCQRVQSADAVSPILWIGQE